MAYGWLFVGIGLGLELGLVNGGDCMLVCGGPWQHGIEKGAVGSAPVASFLYAIRFPHGTLRNPTILSINLFF